MACGRASSFVMVIGASFPSFSYQPLSDGVASGRLGCNLIAHSHTLICINIDIYQNEDQMHLSWAVALVLNS